MGRNGKWTVVVHFKRLTHIRFRHEFVRTRTIVSFWRRNGSYYGI